MEKWSVDIVGAMCPKAHKHTQEELQKATDILQQAWEIVDRDTLTSTIVKLALITGRCGVDIMFSLSNSYRAGLSPDQALELEWN